MYRVEDRERNKHGRFKAREIPGDFRKFYNRELLLDILGSRQDIDWVNTPITYLLGKQIEHPEFSGTIDKLFYKVFGVQKISGKKMPPISDLQMLIWFAMEDRVIDEDNRKIEQLRIAIQHEDLRPDKRLEIMDLVEESAAMAKKRKLESMVEKKIFGLPIEETPGFWLAAMELSHELAQMGLKVDYEGLVRELKDMFRSHEQEKGQ